jgi:hypothetical protein
MNRRFSLAEAKGLLPTVEHLLKEAVALKSGLEQAERRMQAFTGQITLMGGMAVDRARVLNAREERDANAVRLREALQSVQETGCVVKDLDIGLIDFPTLYRGREVYLCWKLGERDIEFWHGVEEGFAGRKPIDQDFLENHQGEREQ